MALRRPRCTICRLPRHERARIEIARLGGVGLDQLAAGSGISRDAIWRHMRDHVTDADKVAYLVDVPLQEMVARAADEGVSLIDHFRVVRFTLMKQFQLAAVCNDRRAVASLAGKLDEVLNSIGRITGEMLRLAPGAVVNNTTIFLNSPMFVDLQSMLMRKLQGHPEALGRVVEGLQELEAKAAPVSNGAATVDASPATIDASASAATPSPGGAYAAG
jgi:hypothetical protein